MRKSSNLKLIFKTKNLSLRGLRKGCHGKVATSTVSARGGIYVYKYKT